MKVSELLKLLEGLAIGLTDLSKKTSDSIQSFQEGLKPFSEMSIEQVIQFLKTSEEYQRTGILTTQRPSRTTKSSPSKLSVNDAMNQVRTILDSINLGSVTTPQIDSSLAHIEKSLSKSDLEQLLASLNISGKPKTKKAAIDTIRNVIHSQLEMFIKSQSFNPITATP